MHQYTTCPSQQDDYGDSSHTPIESTARSLQASLRSHSDCEQSSARSSVDIEPAHAPTLESPTHANSKSSSPTQGKISWASRALGLPLARRLKWKKTWRIPITIIGFYLLALLCAIAHYCLFTYLDGRFISTGYLIPPRNTTIPQSYVTTISLLLVTAVRAALVASVTTCYTQMLWAAFRRLLLKISVIEDLFQVQTNPFLLANRNLFLRTPLLATVAVFCWLVPIATTYPPGALVVGLESSTLDTRYNVSVFHLKSLPEKGNLVSVAMILTPYGPVSFPEAAQDESILQSSRFYEPDDDVFHYITRSSLISGEIARLFHPMSENTSYALELWGTTLDCETKDRAIRKPIVESDLNIPVRDSAGRLEWKFPEFSVSELRSSNDPDFLFRNTTITYRVAKDANLFQYYPCIGSRLENSTNLSNISVSGSISLPETGVHVFVPYSETVCRPRIERYKIIVAHAGGSQQVSYSTIDGGPVPEYTANYGDFNGSFEQWVQFSDAVAVYADFAFNLNVSTRGIRNIFFQYPNSSETEQPYTLDDGTVVQTCPLRYNSILSSNPSNSHLEIWPLSVFQRQLWDPTQTKLDAHGPNFNGPSFDPEMAKELLMNTTISIMSLNERIDVVNGTESLSFNVYHFENKLIFFLPYSLSLVLAIPIIAMGLIALYYQNNGVSAISGGFVQLLMTTTGHTAIDSALEKGCASLGGHENVSKELMNMEIRFGELINDNEDERMQAAVTEPQSDEPSDGAVGPEHAKNGTQNVQVTGDVYSIRRAGFGTVQDIRPLRKRVTRRNAWP